MKYLSICLLFAASLQVLSCEKIFITQEFKNDPAGVFDALWTEFDLLYPLFDAKGINWDSLSTVYRPQIQANMPDDDLHDVMTSMLAQLDDNHVKLYAQGRELFRAGSLNEMSAFIDSPVETFDRSLNRYYTTIKNEYLQSNYRSSAADILIFAGELQSSLTGGLTIGYINIGHGSVNDKSFISEALSSLGSTDGLIIDTRFNTDGEGRLYTYIANLFADQERPFLFGQARNGPKHDDFDKPTSWSLEPVEDSYQKPVIVLTNRHTLGAGEILVLALRGLPHVSIIGDTTGGALSDVILRDLPNGWKYTLSNYLLYTPSGDNYEGIGIPPDSGVVDLYFHVLNRIDQTLDAALEFLTGNN